MRLIDYFDIYVRAGLKIIPLYARTKIPVGQGWNQEWDQDWCRWSLQNYPKSNIGVLLGDIVDVEGDDEDANQIINKLVTDIPHPMYRSSKSIHHLFLNTDVNLTVFKLNNIEFRAHKHQSVLPPSFHEDGSAYCWLKGTTFPVPPMPQILVNYYKKTRSKNPDHVRPWCGICRKRKCLHYKRYNLEKEIFGNLGCTWQCHDCRKFDLRPACRKLKKCKYGY